MSVCGCQFVREWVVVVPDSKTTSILLGEE